MAISTNFRCRCEAVDIQPLDLERWFTKLQVEGLAAPTVAKSRANMVQVYRHAQRQGLISRAPEANPLNFARASTKTSYQHVSFSPEQVAAIIAQLQLPEKVLAVLSAATGLRISESLGLQWQISTSPANGFGCGAHGYRAGSAYPKTEASAAPVPLTSQLASGLTDVLYQMDC